MEDTNFQQLQWEQTLLLGIAEFIAAGVRKRKVSRCLYCLLGDTAYIEVNHSGVYPDQCESYPGSLKTYLNTYRNQAVAAYFIPVRSHVREKLVSTPGLRTAGTINWRGVLIVGRELDVRTRFYTFRK